MVLGPCGSWSPTMNVLLARFLVDLLRSCDAVHVAGETGSGEEAVSVIRFARPELDLLDLRMPKTPTQAVSCPVRHPSAAGPSSLAGCD